MNIKAIQAADPVGKVAAAAHAFLVGHIVDWVSAVRRTGGLDIGDLLTWRDGVGSVRETNAVQVGLCIVCLSRRERVGEGVGESGGC